MRRPVALLLLLVVLAVAVPSATAQGTGLPTITVGIDEAKSPQDLSTALKVLLVLTVLSLAPSILIMMTSFTRIIVVMHFLRQALGTQTAPANQVIVGLSLFLTLFIMLPTYNVVNEKAIQPYLREEIGWETALDAGAQPLRAFMLRQIREKDLRLMVQASGMEKPATMDEVPTYVIIPSFLISELRTAFTIGFMIYLPFLVIDMLIASILMSMGMMMLPPIMISLPFKLLIFVLADGWYLLVGSLIQSFH
jgi:flagellar biosynthesis protein FliP